MNLSLLAVIILLYLAVITNLVYIGYKQTNTSEDYMIAGRDIHPGIMALSYGATFISTSAIVGFGGVAAQFGFSLLWLTFLNIFVGVLIAFAFFGIRIRKMSKNLNSNTFASFIGQRYKNKKLTIFSGFMIFIFMPAYTSIILIGGARFLQEALNIDYNIALFVLAIVVGIYVITGGLKAVMYSDAFSALVMFIGMIFLLIGGYRAVGGVIEGHQRLAQLTEQVPQALTEIGHQGWTSMPALGSPLWWTVMSTIVLGVGIGVLAQPQLSMRFMTVNKTKSLYQAILVGGIFIFMMTGTVFMIGPLSNLYFFEAEGMIAAEMVPDGNIDLIIPTFINEIMPTWFLYLFMLTMLSAAISTVSSLVHVQGAAFGRDIFQTINSLKDEKEINTAFMSRVGVIIGLIAAILLAYIMPISIIARATAFWFGICAAGFLPLLLGALYWKKASGKAAFISALVGYGVSIFGYVFMHASEAGPIGLVQFLLGRETLLGFPWNVIDPLVYSLPISGAVFIIISLINKPVNKKHVQKCFKGISKSNN